MYVTCLLYAPTKDFDELYKLFEDWLYSDDNDHEFTILYAVNSEDQYKVYNGSYNPSDKHLFPDVGLYRRVYAYAWGATAYETVYWIDFMSDEEKEAIYQWAVFEYLYGREINIIRYLVKLATEFINREAQSLISADNPRDRGFYKSVHIVRIIDMLIESPKPPFTIARDLNRDLYIYRCFYLDPNGGDDNDEGSILTVKFHI